MTVQLSPPPAVQAEGLLTATRLGCVAAISLALLAAAAFALGIATPPRTGPWCTSGCIAYPYAEVAQFFPRDYFWMAPAILLPPLFTMLAACVHVCARPSVRPLSLLGLCCAAVAAGVIALDYFVQILVIQPSLLNQEADGIALLTQYNPHGLFIALEDLGYLWLGAAFPFLAAALPSAIKPARSIRWILVAASILVVLSFFAMAGRFRSEMAVPLELALITIDWTTLIVSGILFALFFRRARRAWILRNRDAKG